MQCNVSFILYSALTVYIFKNISVGILWKALVSISFFGVKNFFLNGAKMTVFELFRKKWMVSIKYKIIAAKK